MNYCTRSVITNYRVRKIDAKTGILSTVAGVGTE